MKILSTLFLFVTGFLFCQNFSIHGEIDDKLESEVFLLNEKNEPIRSAISENGIFDFNEVPTGKYQLKLISNNGIEADEPMFVLDKNRSFKFENFTKTKVIETVTLTKKKKAFSVSGGSILVDIAGSSFSKTPTTTDLLSRLPSVIIGADSESLSMIGKGTPILFIGNQEVDFKAFAALSPDDIQSVELIKNPSAKYSAQGKAVIKINLKKSAKDGFKMSLSETLAWRKKFNNYSAANFHFKKNKSEFKANLGYNQLNHWESNGYDYSVLGKNIRSNYIIEALTKRPQYLAGLGFYQDLNDGDYISFSANGDFRTDSGPFLTQTFYSQKDQPQQVLTKSITADKRNYANAFFNYNKKLISIGANIFTGFQYTMRNRTTLYDFYNDTNNSGFLYAQSRDNQSDAYAQSGRIDAEKNIGESYKIEVGGSHTNAVSTANNWAKASNSAAPEIYKYNFQENNLAAYSQLSRSGEKWSAKAGLRLETSDAKGKVIEGMGVNIDRKRSDLFPSAEVSYKLDTIQTITLNYSKTVSRPNYGDISGGALYSSPYVEYAGNFNVLPTFTDTFTANYTINDWSVTASAYRSKNPVGYTLVYDSVRNVSRFTVVNFDRDSGVSLGMDFPVKWRKLTSQNSLSAAYDKTTDSTAALRKSQPYLYFYSSNTVTLPKGFDFLFDGYVLTKRTQGIYERNAQYILNLGMNKSYKNLDFSLRFNDVFKQMKFSELLNYGAISSKNIFYTDTREISLNLKYNFGKVSKSAFKEKKVNDEVGRLK